MSSLSTMVSCRAESSFFVVWRGNVSVLLMPGPLILIVFRKCGRNRRKAIEVPTLRVQNVTATTQKVFFLFFKYFITEACWVFFPIEYERKLNILNILFAHGCFYGLRLWSLDRIRDCCHKNKCWQESFAFVFAHFVTLQLKIFVKISSYFLKFIMPMDFRYGFAWPVTDIRT